MHSMGSRRASEESLGALGAGLVLTRAVSLRAWANSGRLGSGTRRAIAAFREVLPTLTCPGHSGVRSAEGDLEFRVRFQEEQMDIADMTGKTVVITGGNSGIGRETALALAGNGARVVITARDPGRGEAALSTLRSKSPSSQGELVIFDLGDLDEVRSGASQILAVCDRIDVLVNNAGVVLSARRESVDGFEATFATNHLGPFLLTQLLLERLKQSAPDASSTLHRRRTKERGTVWTSTTCNLRSTTGGCRPIRAPSSPTSASPPSWQGVSMAPASRRIVCTQVRWPRATAATVTPRGSWPSG